MPPGGIKGAFKDVIILKRFLFYGNCVSNEAIRGISKGQNTF